MMREKRLRQGELCQNGKKRDDMGNEVIKIEDLSKDYGYGRGVFDISINVRKGECYGFLGPNGAGKSTTIRHLMGFSRPDSGRAFINGEDCWGNAAALKRSIGYIPGEIALPSGMTGKGFLKMLLKMHGCKDDTRCRELLEHFRLKAEKKLREMSLGEKRKLAIVAAFMHEPQILILDEPTSGLDPVMQQEFVDFIMSEKKRGRTIFLSSHIFSEVDAVCDRIAIIRSGRIVSEFTAGELKESQDPVFAVGFKTREAYETFKTKAYTLTADSTERMKVKVLVPQQELNVFINDLSRLQVESFHQVPFSLENYFMSFYKGEEA